LIANLAYYQNLLQSIQQTGSRVMATNKFIRQLKFLIKTRLLLHDLCAKHFDTRAIVAGGAAGAMLTWGHPAVQAAAQVCCKELFKKVQLSLGTMLHMMYYFFTRYN
jgi:hypothetical protein